MSATRVIFVALALCGLSSCSLVLTGEEHQRNRGDASAALDAPGLDAPGLDAPGLDAPGLDAGPEDDADVVLPDASTDAGLTTTVVRVYLGDGPRSDSDPFTLFADSLLVAHHPDGSIFRTTVTENGAAMVEVPRGGMVTVAEGLDGYPTTFYDVPNGAVIELRREVTPSDRAAYQIGFAASVAEDDYVATTGCESERGNRETRSFRLDLHLGCISTLGTYHYLVTNDAGDQFAAGMADVMGTTVIGGFGAFPRVTEDGPPSAEFEVEVFSGYRRLFRDSASGSTASLRLPATGDMARHTATLQDTMDSVTRRRSQSWYQLSVNTTAVVFPTAEFLPWLTTINVDEGDRPTIRWTTVSGAIDYALVRATRWRAFAPHTREQVRYPEMPEGTMSVDTNFYAVELVEDSAVMGYAAALGAYSRTHIAGTRVSTTSRTSVH